MDDWVLILLGLLAFAALGGIILGVIIFIQNLLRSSNTNNRYPDRFPSDRYIERNPPKPPASTNGTSPQKTVWIHDLRKRIQEDYGKLRRAGYEYVELRTIDNDSAFYVRVSKVCDKIAVHFICDERYPRLAPKTLVGKEDLNSYAEIVEKEVDVHLDTLNQWQPGNSLLDVVKEIRLKLQQRTFVLNEHGEIVWQT